MTEDHNLMLAAALIDARWPTHYYTDPADVAQARTRDLDHEVLSDAIAHLINHIRNLEFELRESGR